MNIQPMPADAIDYDRLDPGIRDLVRRFNESGISTCDSGDGVSKPADARSMDVPHVIVSIEQPGLIGLIRAHAVAAQMLALVPQDETPEGYLPWTVQLMYDPADESTVIAAYGPGPLPDGCSPVAPPRAA